MKTLKLSILQGQTISVKISHKRNEVEVDLSTCIVKYRILDGETKEEIYPMAINVDPSVLLVPSDMTFELSGKYDLRVYIDDNGFVDVLNVELSVLQ